MRIWSVLLFFASGVAAETYTRGEFSFAIEPAPDFVATLDVPGTTELPPDGAVRRWLNDTQHDLRGQTVLYRRFVSEALSAQGLGDVAQPRIDFDPSYQRLSLHAIDVTRAGKITSRLKPESVTLARREQMADTMGIYTGLVTAMIELDDVRVGDRVDIRYSLTGLHPVLGEIGGDDYWLAVDHGMVLRHVRVLSKNPQRWRTPAGVAPPTEKKHGDHFEYVYHKQDVAGIVLEPDLPGWAEPYPILERSEAADWRAVARWAVALYPSVAPEPEFSRLVAKFSKIEDANARALAALRFVQDEIRYLSLSLGESTHRPADPDVVLKRRFGDCKDKSRLLVGLLQALDVSAQPVLVNSFSGRALPGKLPRAAVFDHVIVRIELEGGAVFVDPTATLQRGDFKSQGFPDFGHGLIVAADSADLVPLQRLAPSIDGYHSRYTHRVEGADSTAEVQLVWRGAYAEWMRRKLSSESRRSVADALRATLVHTHGNATGLQEIQIEDDEAENRLTIVDRVQVRNFVRSEVGKERFQVGADVIAELLPLAQVAEPKGPMALSHPMTIEQEFIVELPADALPTAERLRVELDDAAVVFERTAQLNDGRFTANFKATTRHYEVRGNGVAEHAQLRRKIHDELSMSVNVNREGAKLRSREERMRALLGEDK